MIFGQKMKLIIITIIKHHNSKHYIHSIQGRIQDLWLGGGVSRRGVWGPLKVSAQRVQGRVLVGGPGGKLWGFEELPTFI